MLKPVNIIPSVSRSTLKQRQYQEQEQRERQREQQPEPEQKKSYDLSQMTTTEEVVVPSKIKSLGLSNVYTEAVKSGNYFPLTNALEMKGYWAKVEGNDLIMYDTSELEYPTGLPEGAKPFYEFDVREYFYTGESTLNITQEQLQRTGFNAKLGKEPMSLSFSKTQPEQKEQQQQIQTDIPESILVGLRMNPKAFEKLPTDESGNTIVPGSAGWIMPSVTEMDQQKQQQNFMKAIETLSAVKGMGYVKQEYQETLEGKFTGGNQEQALSDILENALMIAPEGTSRQVMKDYLGVPETISKDGMTFNLVRADRGAVWEYSTLNQKEYANLKTAEVIVADINKRNDISAKIGLGMTALITPETWFEDNPLVISQTKLLKASQEEYGYAKFLATDTILPDIGISAATWGVAGFVKGSTSVLLRTTSIGSKIANLSGRTRLISKGLIYGSMVGYSAYQGYQSYGEGGWKGLARFGIVAGITTGVSIGSWKAGEGLARKVFRPIMEISVAGPETLSFQKYATTLKGSGKPILAYGEKVTIQRTSTGFKRIYDLKEIFRPKPTQEFLALPSHKIFYTARMLKMSEWLREGVSFKPETTTRTGIHYSARMLKSLKNLNSGMFSMNTSAEASLMGRITMEQPVERTISQIIAKRSPYELWSLRKTPQGKYALFKFMKENPDMLERYPKLFEGLTFDIQTPITTFAEPITATETAIKNTSGKMVVFNKENILGTQKAFKQEGLITRDNLAFDRGITNLKFDMVPITAFATKNATKNRFAKGKLFSYSYQNPVNSFSLKKITTTKTKQDQTTITGLQQGKAFKFKFAKLNIYSYATPPETTTRTGGGVAFDNMLKVKETTLNKLPPVVTGGGGVKKRYRKRKIIGRKRQSPIVLLRTKIDIGNIGSVQI